MEWSQSSETEESQQSNHSRFLTFLATAQRLQLDFLPITWHRGLPALGAGQTTEVRQSLVTVERSFAFKLRERRTHRTDSEHLDALRNEAIILLHPPVRKHQYIVDVLGCFWESDIACENIWPVLVFPKADYGSFQQFLSCDMGRDSTIDTKWGLCCNIIEAVRTLHACEIVHCDLKPDNCLVFQESGNGFVAKITDFGFSCFGETDKDIIKPPKTEPWADPGWHHRGMSVKRAKLVDVFSLGMVCLWAVMEHAAYASSATGERTVNTCRPLSHSGQQPSISTLHRHKRQDSLGALVSETIQSLPQLSESQKSKLVSRLTGALRHNPAEREADISKLADGMIFEGQADEIDLRSCSTIQDCDHEDFRLAGILPQLSFASYAVRLKIMRSLETALSPWKLGENGLCCQRCSKNTAFQLAVALRIGLAGIQSDEEGNDWLNRSSRSFSDMKDELNDIRDGNIALSYSGEFEKLQTAGLIYLPDFAEDYHQIGSNEPSESACKNEIAAFSASLGASHFATIALKQVLASMYKGRSAYTEALQLEQECVESLQGSGLGNSIFALKMMLRLGSTFSQMTKYGEALDLQEKALSLAKLTLEPTHPTVINADAQLACTYWEMGNWAQAETEFSRLSQTSDWVFGRCHPQTLSLKANIAMSQKKLGKLDASLRLERLIAKECLDTLGAGDSMTWRIISNLADTYIGIDKFDEAEEVLKRLDLPTKDTWREMSVDKLRVLNLLARVYISQQRVSDAQLILLENIKIQSEILGPRHHETLQSLILLARLALKDGDHNRSMGILEDVFQTHGEPTDAYGNPFPMSMQTDLVDLYKMLKLWEKAALIEHQILSRQLTTLGPNHPQTLQTTAAFSETLANQERYEEMDNYHQLISESKVSKIGSGEAVSAILAPLARVGSILLDQKDQFSRAQQILEKVASTASRTVGPESMIALTAMGNLASAYALDGKHVEAHRTYLKLIMLKIQAFGRDTTTTLTTIANFEYFCKSLGIDADFTKYVESRNGSVGGLKKSS